MNTLQNGIIKIIYSALSGEAQQLPEDFSVEKALGVAKRHNIEPLLYYGALCCGISGDEPLMQQLFMTTCMHVAANGRQMHELETLFSAFDDAKVDYMPIKGTLLKKLYPKGEMRAMGDADVLIRTEQYDIIKPIVQKLGFAEGPESLCELVWDKPGILHLELHKAITPPNVEDYYQYFGTGWDKAKLVNEGGSRYELSLEDHFLFVFTHFARHYRSGGIGIKHMTDIWIYKKSYPDMDYVYIENELKKLRLYDFYLNVCDTLGVWFDGKEDTLKSDFITEVVFDNGVFGKKSNEILSEAVKQSKKTGTVGEAKRSKTIWLLFLPYNLMCLKYPILKKLPFLLPFMWVVRGVNAILFRRDKVVHNFEQVNDLDEAKIENRRKSLDFVGLDFSVED